MQHSKGAFVDLIFLIPVYHSGADLSSAPGSVDRGADEGALEAGLGQLIFALIQVLPGQDLFGALLGGLGAGLVALLGPPFSTVSIPPMQAARRRWPSASTIWASPIPSAVQ